MSGIDYGNGLVNIDLKTGIRYGVIPDHMVGQFWYDDAEAYYGEPECPTCECVIPESLICGSCGKEWQPEDCYSEEPISFFIDTPSLKAHQSGDDRDIFVTYSEWTTTGAFCSPCAPGAVYLPDYREDGVEAYCFGPEWFDEADQPIPYTAFPREL